MDKSTALRELYDSICAAWPENRIVTGEGDPDAAVLLIGEAPGAQEEQLGRPFVGKAGKNLDALLQLSGLQREQLYISNTVKLRPCKPSPSGNIINRPPTEAEIAAFLPYLHREIGILSPRFIVTLGNVPLKALLGHSAAVGKLHGQWTKWNEIPLFPLYHPASLIYNPSLRPQYEQDVCALGEAVRC